jgi:hypothetical protein
MLMALPSALPGSINNQGLFSSHYLTRRLPTLSVWNSDISHLIAELERLYSSLCDVAETWNEAQTESEFIRPVLDLLEWEYIVQVSYKSRKRQNVPDYALFANAPAKRKAYQSKTDAAEFYALARSICDAKYWGRTLDSESKNDQRDAFTNANPSFQIINYMVGTDVAWGMLTNGQVWRLYAQRVRSRTTTFFEVNLADAIRSKDELALRYFVTLFRCSAFQPEPLTGQSLLDQVLDESAKFAVTVQDELKELVFEQVAPLVAQGFVQWRKNEQGVATETPETLSQIYTATLTTLYRVLFLFYAEARELLPVHDTLGYRQFSLLQLCRQIADDKSKGMVLSERTKLIWDMLTNLFRIIAKGDPQLGVPIYNGGLFKDERLVGDLSLPTLALADKYLAEAIDLLARREDKAAGEKLFIDYRDLDVRHLGSIYEGLLEFRPLIAEHDLALVREKGQERYVPAKKRPVAVLKGALYLANDKGQRKATGSYYTPDYIVKHIVSHTLDPILRERETRFRTLMDQRALLRKKLARESNPARNRLLQLERERLEAEVVSALLDVKVCDPAMGSGHFLVEAVGYLTDRLAALLAEYPGNPLIALIEQVRQQIKDNLRAQGIEMDWPQLDDKHLLKRMVMKRCIYGVDLNPMAVELSKLSLWLDSFTIGAPLSFLDHHLKRGNSLVGTRAQDVQHALSVVETRVRAPRERKVRNGLQGDLFGSPFAGLLTATALMRDVTTLTDATLEEVEQSANKYATFEREMLPYKRVLDLWIARYYQVPEAENFLRLYGSEALKAVAGDTSRISPEYRKAIALTQAAWEANRFFHWDLEFPEVFIDLAQTRWKASPGFDAVISNPPYVDVSADTYFRAAFHCAPATNLYAYFLERSGKFLAPGGRLGVIVPLSLVCSERMSTLREWLAENMTELWVANFGIRPAKIFPGVDQRVTIVLATRQDDSALKSCRLWSTRYHRWREDEQFEMIANLNYADITGLSHSLGWPKLGDETGRKISKKLFAQKSRLRDYLQGNWQFFYHGIGRYWLKAYDFEPTFLKADGQPGRSTTLFDLRAPSAEVGYVILAIINSSLFFWYWDLHGDDFHLKHEEIASFPFTYHEGHKHVYEQLKQQAKALMRDYKKNSVLKRGKYATGEITWQEFYPRKSKAIIDKIDDLLGMLYGLTRDQVEYIKSYDLEFRTDEDEA